MDFLNYSIGMGGPGQVVGDLDQTEALDPFYFIPIDVDRGMFSFTLPEIDDNLLRFVDIEGEIIVVAPNSPDSLSHSYILSRHCWRSDPLRWCCQQT